MKYNNNNKNIKNFLWVKILALPLLFFVIETEAFIHKVDILVNKETGQKIICLGDLHEHPAHWKGTKNENIAEIQKADIIALAKKLDAIILLEVPPFETAVWQHTTKEQEKELASILIKSRVNTTMQCVLDGLYEYSIVNNIRCENVECRVSPKVRVSYMTLQGVFDRAEQTAKKIAKFNDAEPFKKIYKEELNNFNVTCLTFKELLNKLGKYSNIPIDELKELIGNKQINLSDDALLTLINFSNIIMPIDLAALNRSNLQADTIGILIDSVSGFPWEFVDMHVLHAIAQNEKISPIIVVAGSMHTNHVVKRLQQCGYTIKKSIGKDLISARSVFFPSVVDLKIVFSNLEQTGYVQKTKNFFRHFWKKIITVLYLCSMFYQIFG